MKFTVNASPAPDGKKPAAVKKIESICTALKNGELISVLNLSSRIGLTQSTTSDHVRRIDQSFRVLQGNTFYYGNKKTIAAYRKQIQG